MLHSYILAMSLLKHLNQNKAPLPTVHQTGIGERATAEANCQDEKVVEEKQSGKQKHYTTFTDENRVQIGRYTTENGNTRAVKWFKLDFPNLSESTVCTFKSKYVMKAQEKWKENDFTTVTISEVAKQIGGGTVA